MRQPLQKRAESRQVEEATAGAGDGRNQNNASFPHQDNANSDSKRTAFSATLVLLVLPEAPVAMLIVERPWTSVAVELLVLLCLLQTRRVKCNSRGGSRFAGRTVTAPS